jgi:hypothetical protein
MAHPLGVSPAPATGCYRAVRRCTEALREPLAVEGCGLQSTPVASRVKWRLVHTTWCFETFLLTPHLPNYRPFESHFAFLFSSYYEAVGPRWPRPQRGLLSRPTVAEVYGYRACVDEQMEQLLQHTASGDQEEDAAKVRLGLNQEQQLQARRTYRRFFPSETR